MQIELSTVVGLLGGILSTALGIYVTLLRYAVGQREAEIDRRIAHADTENVKISDRLNSEEKATIRQDGEIRLVKQIHDEVKSDIEEVKRTMVTKAEWEPRMTNLERTMNQILSELRGRQREYPSHGQMAAVNPSPPPKR